MATAVLMLGGVTGIAPVARAGENASAQPTQLTLLRALHWNIAGSTINPFDPDKPDNEGTFEVVRHLLSVAESTEPQLISMNETCESQARFAATELTDRLGQAMMHFADRASIDPLCAAGAPGSSLNAGNAIIAIGANATWQRQVFYFNDDGTFADGKTDRSAVCMLVSFRSTLDEIVRACSLHLETDEAIALAQATTLARHMAQDVFPAVLLGDFNVEPDVIRDAVYHPLQGGQGAFVEVDHPGNRPTFSDRKIDYIFGSAEHFSLATSATVLDGGVCPSLPFSHPCSDHQLLFGILAFRAEVPPPPPPDDPPDPPPPPPTDMSPFVFAGLPVSGDEGATVSLLGAADDDHGPPAVTWSFEVVDEVDPGTVCTIVDGDRPRATITCTDEGIFRVTLTAVDGVNPPVSSTTTLRIRNVAPELELSSPQPWDVVRAGTAVDVTAPFTDPGTNDTHSCAVAWDDGTQETYEPVDGACDRSHTFDAPGMYTIKVTVTDDDGGADTAEVLVIAFDPDAGFVTAGGWIDSPAGAVVNSPDLAGRAHFHINPRYLPHDDGPAPGSGHVALWLQGRDFEFDSTSLEWLVVTPDGKTAVKGTGTVAGEDGYGFVLYGYDEPDMLRLVVWPLASGSVPGNVRTYDNSPNGGFDLDEAEPPPIARGSITIHH